MPLRGRPVMKIGLANRLIDDAGVAPLRVLEPQQVGQEAQHIPPCCHAADQAERCLLGAGDQQPPQRIDERRISEVPKPAAPLCDREQGIGVEGTPQYAQHIRNPIRDVQNQVVDRQTEVLLVPSFG